MGGVSERERGLGCCRAENSRCNTQKITFTFGNLSFPPFSGLFSLSFSYSLAHWADAKFVSRLNPQQFMEIEPEMLAMETIVPVYFAVEDDELLSIYEQTRAASASQGSASAAEGEF